MGFSFKVESDLLGKFITVRTAAEISGYNQQYLRRLLRDDTFLSKRLGQIWLIDKADFLQYLMNAKESDDKRFGPH